MNTKNRRSFLTKISALLATFGIGKASTQTSQAADQQAASGITRSGGGTLFSSAVAHGGLLYIAGKGAHFEGDIKAHTDHVLKEIEKELTKNGSSMQRVLKVNVYLHDLNDYKAMNEVYRGRFGNNAPVRTTVACFGGVPGNSLVEIDCIAALD